MLESHEKANGLIRLSLVAGIVLALGGCMTPKTPTDYYELAIASAQQGYAELELMNEDTWKSSETGALFHFNMAIDYFKEAVGYLSKADLSPEDQPGFTALKSGLSSLESAVNELDTNDLDKAKADFAVAQSQFEVAAKILQ